MAYPGPHESPQVRTGRVVAVIAITLAFLVLIAFGFQVPFRDRIGQSYTVQTSFPLPGVVPDERERRISLEEHQRAALNSGERIDKAMDAIAAKGAHAFDPLAPSP